MRTWWIGSVILLGWVYLVVEIIFSHWAWYDNYLLLVMSLASLFFLRFNYKIIPIEKFDFIQNLVNQTNSRSTDDNSPITINTTPPELKSLVEYINKGILGYNKQEEFNYKLCAHLAHHFRSPLTGIRLQAQVVQRSEDVNQINDSLQQIISTVDKTAQMVEQVLMYMKLKFQHYICNDTNFNPTTSISKIIDSFEPITESNNMQIQSSEESDFLIRFDPILFDTFFRNLLFNVTQHQQPNVKINIETININDELVEISVSDSGPGLLAVEYDEDNGLTLPEIPSTNNAIRLAICDSIANLYHSDLSFCHSVLGGLKVSIILKKLQKAE